MTTFTDFDPTRVGTRVVTPMGFMGTVAMSGTTHIKGVATPMVKVSPDIAPGHLLTFKGNAIFLGLDKCGE